MDVFSRAGDFEPVFQSAGCFELGVCGGESTCMHPRSYRSSARVRFALDPPCAIPPPPRVLSHHACDGFSHVFLPLRRAPHRRPRHPSISSLCVCVCCVGPSLSDGVVDGQLVGVGSGRTVPSKREGRVEERETKPEEEGREQTDVVEVERWRRTPWNETRSPWPTAPTR